MHAETTALPRTGGPGDAPAHSTAEHSPSIAKKEMEQGAVLFALHNDLRMHQQSVNRAFSSLDRACCALAALVVEGAEKPGLSERSSNGDSATSTEAPSSSPSVAREFAQLLLQVEALHDFLFTNLYVHQRDCALRLLSNVERTVLAEASTAATGVTPASAKQRDDVTAGSEGACANDTSGKEELRHQIRQLRYILTSPPHSCLESRAVLPAFEASPQVAVDSSLAPCVPQTTDMVPREAAADVDHDSVPSSPPCVEKRASLPCPSTDTRLPQVSLSSSFTTVPAVLPSRHRPFRRQHHFFALSANFVTAGRDGGWNQLCTVLYAIQRRVRIHGVVCGSTAGTVSPQEEVQLALLLGCVCLVVPQECLDQYPTPSPMKILSDHDVLVYDRSKDHEQGGHRYPHWQQQQRQRGGVAPTAGRAGEGGEAAFTMTPHRTSSFSESDSEGEDDLMRAGTTESASALEELFQSLEADVQSSAFDYKSLWPSPAAALHDAATMPLTDATGGGEGEERGGVVVQRAALKRGARQQAVERGKRRRHDPGPHGYHDDPPFATAPSSVSAGVAGATSTEPLSAEALMGATAEDVGMTGQSTWPDSAVGEAFSELNSLSQRHGVESQHIGITQYGPPQFAAAPPADVSVPSTPPFAAHPATTDNADGVSPPPPPPRPVFQISNSVKYLKPQLMAAIEQLGGEVDLSSGYSRSCRYLVVAEGITERTEKYLGACAAAAHIVPPRYVFDSQRRGYWLENRIAEYDMSPQRNAAHHPRPMPIFRSWRVVLITCRSAAARGVRAALLAGGCTQATAFVVDLTAETPLSAGGRKQVLDETSAVDGVVEGVCPTSVIAATTLAAATHILVECSSVTARGYFQLPDWVPVCVRRPEYASRLFTLELLYFCLCAHPERVFDGAGLLCDEEALTPACRVEPTKAAEATSSEVPC
jgi:hypothetical protein